MIARFAIIAATLAATATPAPASIVCQSSDVAIMLARKYVAIADFEMIYDPNKQGSAEQMQAELTALTKRYCFEFGSTPVAEFKSPIRGLPGCFVYEARVSLQNRRTAVAWFDCAQGIE